MGFAMIIVMFFHAPLPSKDLFYGLMRCGNNGVDMFLFLSGIGLWFSWTKKNASRPSFLSFYYRRIDIYGGIFIYLLSSVALAMLLKWILKFIPKP